MRWLLFFGILLLSAGLCAGCIFPHGNPSGPAPADPNGSVVNYGGSALAVAFKGSEISTTSPEAEERFFTGLQYSTGQARYNESLGYFDEALAIDPDFSDAWVAKAVALHNMKRYDEAILCYNRALLISPGDAAIWHLKGVTLRDSGNPEESAACYRREAELDPRYGTR
ncbi:MAG: tetratricopeptide repeat protein [Methanoregula sp.]